ncbi:anaerobic C4-dicarboxylate transporter family protein [Enterobacteriaceae endosymbiont of Neohaemonia nigricornis]|uniref:anaerobic C4-dicarboxylate transporter family protein n=1 Tax=Enterobacteriaceae endosymbiont of Neohaemonia nigricornis TaxID=2675792 RepID=UPI00144986FA|nr:anaerobic C4-dicarboxylate transporter family protein [Enterobacteriaceae endosymbiont of Neohaemonia nigricornis]QJC30375.1 anaerobic C4-dicarboxylate transporter [Enterobacteriaceae endosymbiont of Neohaemonia nigricornis]
MLIIEFIIVLTLICLGNKFGGIGLGLCSYVGVLILTLFFHQPVGDIPFDVVEIILAVIITISTLHLAGGINYIIFYIDKILSNKPKYIIIIAPMMTYFITIITGTSYTALFIFPIILNITKKYGIKPVYALSISVIASQIAVIASPISASLILLSKLLNPLGVSYNKLLLILIPSTFISVLITSIILSYWYKLYNKKKYVYNNQILQNIYLLNNKSKYSLIIFIIGIIIMLVYNTVISSIYKQNIILPRTESIILFMFTISLFISLICKISFNQITQTKIFQSGINSCICVMGVSWLSNTFINANIEIIKFYILYIIKYKPGMLSIILCLITSLFYSQAATTKTIIPHLIELKIPLDMIISTFPAVSALFLLPTYPTMLHAIQIDDTKSTKTGTYIINHSFFIPGLIVTTLSISIDLILVNFILK